MKTCEECTNCGDCQDKTEIFYVPAKDDQSLVQRVDRATRDALEAEGKPVFDTFPKAFYFETGEK